MPAGQTPHTVIVFAHNDLVDKVQPGDRVTVTGIYRAVSLRVNPMVSNVKSVYRTHIDVVHYRKVDVHRLRNETERGYVLFQVLTIEIEVVIIFVCLQERNTISRRKRGSFARTFQEARHLRTFGACYRSFHLRK